MKKSNMNFLSKTLKQSKSSLALTDTRQPGKSIEEMKSPPQIQKEPSGFMQFDEDDVSRKSSQSEIDAEGNIVRDFGIQVKLPKESQHQNGEKIDFSISGSSENHMIFDPVVPLHKYDQMYLFNHKIDSSIAKSITQIENKKEDFEDTDKDQLLSNVDASFRKRQATLRDLFGQTNVLINVQFLQDCSTQQVELSYGNQVQKKDAYDNDEESDIQIQVGEHEIMGNQSSSLASEDQSLKEQQVDNNNANKILMTEQTDLVDQAAAIKDSQQPESFQPQSFGEQFSPLGNMISPISQQLIKDEKPPSFNIESNIQKQSFDDSEEILEKQASRVFQQQKSFKQFKNEDMGSGSPKKMKFMSAVIKRSELDDGHQNNAVSQQKDEVESSVQTQNQFYKIVKKRPIDQFTLNSGFFEFQTEDKRPVGTAIHTQNKSLSQVIASPLVYEVFRDPVEPIKIEKVKVKKEVILKKLDRIVLDQDNDIGESSELLEPDNQHKKAENDEVKLEEIEQIRSAVELCISIDFQGDLKEDNFQNQLTFLVNSSINAQYLEYSLSYLKRVFEHQKDAQKVYEGFRERIWGIEEKIKEIYCPQSISQYKRIQSQTDQVKTLFKTYIILIDKVEHLFTKDKEIVHENLSLILSSEMKNIANGRISTKTLAKLPICFGNSKNKAKQIKSVLKKLKHVIQRDGQIYNNHDVNLKLALTSFNLKFNKSSKQQESQQTKQVELINLTNEDKIEKITQKKPLTTEQEFEDILKPLKQFPCFKMEVKPINEINPEDKRVKVLRESILLININSNCSQFEILSYNISNNFFSDLVLKLSQSISEQRKDINLQHHEITKKLALVHAHPQSQNPVFLKRNWWAKINEDQRSLNRQKSSKSIQMFSQVLESQQLREVNALVMMDQQKERIEKMEKRNLLTIQKPQIVQQEQQAVIKAEKSQMKDSVSRAHGVSNKEMYFNSPKQSQEQLSEQLSESSDKRFKNYVETKNKMEGVDEVRYNEIVIDSPEKYMMRILDKIQDLRVLNNCEYDHQIVQLIKQIDTVQQNIINKPKTVVDHKQDPVDSLPKVKQPFIKNKPDFFIKGGNVYPKQPNSYILKSLEKAQCVTTLVGIIRTLIERFSKMKMPLNEYSSFVNTLNKAKSQKINPMASIVSCSKLIYSKSHHFLIEDNAESSNKLPEFSVEFWQSLVRRQRESVFKAEFLRSSDFSLKRQKSRALSEQSLNEITKSDSSKNLRLQSQNQQWTHFMQIYSQYVEKVNLRRQREQMLMNNRKLPDSKSTQRLLSGPRQIGNLKNMNINWPSKKLKNSKKKSYSRLIPQDNYSTKVSLDKGRSYYFMKLLQMNQVLIYEIKVQVLSSENSKTKTTHIQVNIFQNDSLLKFIPSFLMNDFDFETPVASFLQHQSTLQSPVKSHLKQNTSLVFKMVQRQKYLDEKLYDTYIDVIYQKTFAQKHLKTEQMLRKVIEFFDHNDLDLFNDQRNYEFSDSNNHLEMFSVKVEFSNILLDNFHEFALIVQDVFVTKNQFWNGEPLTFHVRQQQSSSIRSPSNLMAAQLRMQSPKTSMLQNFQEFDFEGINMLHIEIIDEDEEPKQKKPKPQKDMNSKGKDSNEKKQQVVHIQPTDIKYKRIFSILPSLEIDPLSADKLTSSKATFMIRDTIKCDQNIMGESSNSSQLFFDIYILYKSQNDISKVTKYLKQVIKDDKTKLLETMKECLNLSKQIYAKEILWKQFYESESSLQKMSIQQMRKLKDLSEKVDVQTIDPRLKKLLESNTFDIEAYSQLYTRFNSVNKFENKCFVLQRQQTEEQQSSEKERVKELLIYNPLKQNIMLNIIYVIESQKIQVEVVFRKRQGREHQLRAKEKEGPVRVSKTERQLINQVINVLINYLWVHNQQ